MAGYLMTEPREKHPREKYEEAKQKLEKIEFDFQEKIAVLDKKISETTNRATATYKKDCDRLASLKTESVIKKAEQTRLVNELKKSSNTIHLSDTCKKKLVQIYCTAKTGREREIVSKYLEKGIGVEEKEITLISKIDNAFYVKNTVRKYNEFIEGECDVDNSPIDIQDAKASWDAPSFYDRTVEEPDSNKIYWYQGQCYMELYDCDNYKIRHCLVNTPTQLLEDEKTRALYKIGSDKKDTELYRKICEEIDFNGTFDDIPDVERVFTKSFTRDREAYQRLVERIKECRRWLNQYAKIEYIKCYGSLPDGITLDENISDDEMEEETDIEHNENHETPPFNVEQRSEDLSDNETENKETILQDTNNKSGTEEIERRAENDDSGLPSPPPFVMPTQVDDDEEGIETVISSIIHETFEEVKNEIEDNPVLLAKGTHIDLEDSISEVNSEKQKMLLEIELLDSKLKCIEYYKSNMQKLRLYKEVMESLTVKRNSFGSDTGQTSIETKKEVVPEVKSEIKETPKVVTVDDLYKEVEKCKTAQDVKDLYKVHRDIVDNDKALRIHFKKIGIDRGSKPLA
jgi:hypothetical protein